MLLYFTRLLCIFALFVTVSACSPSIGNTHPILVNQSDLEDSNGQVATLSHIQGKIVLLHFWATWCPSCVTELSALEKLYKQIDHKKFELVAVALGNTPEELRDFLLKQQLSFPIYADPAMRVGHYFGIKDLPASLLYNQDAKLINFPFANTSDSNVLIIGPQEWNSNRIVNALKKLL